MVITNAEQLKKYETSTRQWQGIPGVERTKKGRIFVTWYSGGEVEQLGNHSLVVKSDDGGKRFSEPIIVVDVGTEARSYDPCLWIDPLGRLWFIWAEFPNNAVKFVRCDNPDAETLTWSEEKILGYDVMLNKPIVTSDGAWLFPCAVWKKGLLACGCGSDGTRLTGAHTYVSYDQGETFSLLGTAVAKDRGYDEHMLLEKNDGSLECYIRTKYGIAVSESRDGGKTWSAGVDCGLGGPNSRFFIGRLSSGNLLLINHHRFAGRNNLTAMISRDDGKTFEGFLLLDERADVSYPDAVEGSDGFIYVVYDRERGAKYNPEFNYDYHAREILMAKVTEEDILNGCLTNPESSLKMLVNKVILKGKNDQ